MIKVEAHTQLFHVISFGDRTHHRKKKKRKKNTGNIFLALKNMPSNIKYVGEQVLINGSPGGNTK